MKDLKYSITLHDSELKVQSITYTKTALLFVA